MGSLKTYNEYISWFYEAKEMSTANEKSGKAKRKQKQSKKRRVYRINKKDIFLEVYRTISYVLFVALIIGIDIYVLSMIFQSIVSKGEVNQYSVIYVLMSVLVILTAAFPTDHHIGSFTYWLIMFLGCFHIIDFLNGMFLDLAGGYPFESEVGAAATLIILAGQTVLKDRYSLNGHDISVIMSMLGTVYLTSFPIITLAIAAENYEFELGINLLLLAAGILGFLWAVNTAGDMSEERFKSGHTLDRLWEKIKYI